MSEYNGFLPGINTGNMLFETGKPTCTPYVNGMVNGEFQLGETGLVAQGAQVLGTASKNGGAVFVNRIGKGKAILLNLSLGGYQAISLGGVGGETSSVKTGAETFCQNMRTILDGILKTARAQHNSVVTHKQSHRFFPCQTTLRKDGENHVFGILNPCVEAPDGVYPMRYHKKFLQDIHIQLPVSGHLYNVRTGQYLGQGSDIDLSLMPGDGQVFAILQDRVKDVSLKAPDTVRPGQALTVSFKANGGSGPHVFHLNLIAPDSKAVRHYAQNARFKGPQGTMTFQTAFNDQPGTWTIQVRNVNTGLIAERKLELQAR